jgi:Glycosyltransferase sugar-binding region containing DXD motif
MAVPAKRVVQEWTVSTPLHAKDPSRLIPRIIHQTWFEHLDTESYPNMMRLVESFKQSGWEYRFYTEEDMVVFLKLHMPAPVLEAYQALRHGAYRSDIFRLCVLLLSGGLYADVDMLLLQSALDIYIPGDVGFMVPTDMVRWILSAICGDLSSLKVLELSAYCCGTRYHIRLTMQPGTLLNKQMCVANGIIAAAPGHRFLAKALETVVNQVRNRFTIVDIDATFCPNPELSVCIHGLLCLWDRASLALASIE